MIDPKSPDNQMDLFPSVPMEKQLIHFTVRNQKGTVIHKAVIDFKNRKELMPTLERFSQVLNEHGSIHLRKFT